MNELRNQVHGPLVGPDDLTLKLNRAADHVAEQDRLLEPVRGNVR